MKAKLSALWIFATLNYLYCDVVTLMDPGKLSKFLAGRIGAMDVNQGFLLAASVLVEIPIAMVLVSLLVDGRTNRWANMAVGLVMTAVQVSTLLFAAPAPYHLFFSVIEIGCTSLIVWLAWRWGRAPRSARHLPYRGSVNHPTSARYRSRKKLLAE